MDRKRIFKMTLSRIGESDAPDEDVKRDILDSSCGDIKKAKFLSIAQYTKKLYSYAVYCCKTNYIPDINADCAEKKFINAIAKYLGYRKIFRESMCADLTLYDIDSPYFDSNPKFILRLKNLDIFKKDTFGEISFSANQNQNLYQGIGYNPNAQQPNFGISAMPPGIMIPKPNEDNMVDYYIGVDGLVYPSPSIYPHLAIYGYRFYQPTDSNKEYFIEYLDSLEIYLAEFDHMNKQSKFTLMNQSYDFEANKALEYYKAAVNALFNNNNTQNRGGF